MGKTCGVQVRIINIFRPSLRNTGRHNPMSRTRNSSVNSVPAVHAKHVVSTVGQGVPVVHGETQYNCSVVCRLTVLCEYHQAEKRKHLSCLSPPDDTLPRPSDIYGSRTEPGVSSQRLCFCCEVSLTCGHRRQPWTSCARWPRKPKLPPTHPVSVSVDRVLDQARDGSPGQLTY